MLNLRLRKIMVLISGLIVLFVMYQLSLSEPNIRNTRDSVLTKEGKLDEVYEERITSFNVEQNSFDRNFLPRVDAHSKGDLDLKESKNLPPLFVGQKIVHLDLKGAPPKVSFYKELFPLLKSLGATGLLMEYEDMLPYEDANIPATNAYSKSDIKIILDTAEENNLEVIPLIQTFGHLEFVLKLEEYESLREVPRYPQVICPSRNGTSQLIKRMIDNMVALHPNSRYLHIGCDEVYNLGECSQCVDTLMKKNWTKQQLFLSHVTMVARYIKEKYPKLKVLMWDDEFRHVSVEEMKAFNFGALVEPVVWKYTPDIEADLPFEMWDKYASVFGSVWIASAFKGATGPDVYITDINYHLENHRSWMRIVAAHKDRLKFEGIMITGWQRYDHFAVLCELLPVGLPSLAVNLAFLSQGNIDMHSVPKSVTEVLKCGPGLLYSKMAAHCHFPGSEVYSLAHKLHTLLDQVGEMEGTGQAKGWLNQYNIHTGFSQPAHVEGATADVDRYKMELQYLEQDMRRAMSEVFDNHTVREWVYTYMTPTHKRLQALWQAKEKLLAARTWPRRPIDVHDL